MACEDLGKQIDQALPRDQRRLRELWRRIGRAERQGLPHDRNLARLQRDLQRSVALRAYRREHVPELRYEGDLPIHAKRAEIVAAIRDCPVIVVCGETGSGKSTQLPKFCLEAGRGRDGMIGHTQPRRLAARSIAARVAEELGGPLGQHVGYKIRFADETREETYVKLMTDGILLAETQGDPRLERYDALIIDEAHERSLNIDFLLGLLQRILQRRRDLRVVVTSATIDAQRFADFFAGPAGPPPVIQAEGRSYPIDVQYAPIEFRGDEGESETCRAAAEAIAELAARRDGDVLAFLPTEWDIRETARLLRGRLNFAAQGGPEIIPLYARLSTAEQHKAFETLPQGRVVLATNVAESSLTVPSIRYVVDTGLARVSRYSARTRVQRLPIEPVAQASADQRAGRCGRIGPGVCVRLYSESDYLSRPRYAVPEIRRTHLAAVILRMLALRLGAIEDFPFLDRPKPEAIQEGWQTLRELQAVDAQGGLTPIGERLSRLPVDPRVGRMVLAAIELGCVSEVLIIAAALEIQDPRERPAGNREAAEAKHARFADTRSDFLSYLRLWDYFHELRGQTSHRAFRKACREQFLSFARLREWQEVYRQLRDLVVQAGGTLTPRADNYAAVHRALLTGLLSSIAVRRGPHDYATPRGDAFFLWPGSGSFARKPKWLVAAEAVETTRKYLRTVASIQREWLEPLAAHLVERTYHGAHWSTKRQAVLAYERVHLFGLSIAPRRTTPFGPIDPALAREVFVREALLHEGLQRRFAFQQHNRQLLEELSAWGAKRRVPHLMADEAALWAFYDARVPSGVYDLETFRRWYHRELRRDPHALLLSREELAPGEPLAESQSFPDQWQCGPAACTLDYRFAPGDADDGVSLSIGRELLPLLSDDQLGWLVPGLLEEKLVALIRLLPKPIRTRLVPAPNVAQSLAQRLSFGDGPFLPRVAEAMSRLAGVRVTPDMLPVDKLPPHLRLHVRVVDAAGTVLTQGRSLAELRAWAGLGRGTAGQRYLEHPDWSQSGLTDWTWGDLPPTLELEQGAFRLTGTPGLLDEGRAVGLRLFAWAQEAREQTRAGVRRLLLLNRPEAIGQQVKWLPDWPRLRLLAQRIPSQAPFAEEVAELLVDRALGPDAQVPRTQAAYARLTDELEDRLALAVQDVAPLLGPLVERYVEADEALRRLPRRAERTAGADIREQLAELFAPSYLVHTPWEWLQHVPRYLAAISVRIGRLCAGGDLQDARMMAELAAHWERWRDLRDRDPWSRFDIELTRYRWWLEELRVSLFAQQLGTALKVSGKRLDEQWERVGQPAAEAGTNSAAPPKTSPPI